MRTVLHLALFTGLVLIASGCEAPPADVNWRVVPSGGGHQIEGTIVNTGETATNIRLVFSTPSSAGRPDLALKPGGLEPPALELRIEGLRVGETRRFRLPVRNASGYDLDRLEAY